MIDYNELLRDPQWQRKRLEIMQRDDFQCCACGNTKETLNVHHIKYEKGKNPWEYDNNMLITLCESCHKNEKDWKDKRVEYLYNRLKNELLGTHSLFIIKIIESIMCKSPETEDSSIKFLSIFLSTVEVNMQKHGPLKVLNKILELSEREYVERKE